MASLKERGKTYWHLYYRDLDTGLWREKSLKLRRDDAGETRQAQKIRDKQERDENQISNQQGGEFYSWVPPFIEKHYTNPRSLDRYKGVWENKISPWLQENKLRHPRHIKYIHAEEYMEWSKQKVSQNTARLELKFFSSLMTEAKRREFAISNPLEDARIPKQPSAPKREITDKEIKKIHAGLKTKPSWMGVVFQILINLGCRFNEARIPKTRVNFRTKPPTITIEDSKRQQSDARKLYTVAMDEGFAEYLKKIKWVDGYTVPPLDYYNLTFNKALKEICGVTSHCCRVTFITRCHRYGLTEQEAMDLVNHSSEDVHRIYRKMNIQDSAAARKKIIPPPPPV